jgi:hypothetical protein
VWRDPSNFLLCTYNFRSYSRPLEDLEVQPPLPSEFAFITLQCCEAAVKCCEQVLSADSDVQDEVSLIQATHDNLFLSHARPEQSVGKGSI